MSISQFLEESTTDVKLGIFRKETEVSVAAEPIEDIFEDSDDESEDEEEEEMKERYTRAPGKLWIRKFSKSLLALIHKYDPDLVCVSSDVSCLLSYIEINIKKVSNKNLTKFETEVQQLKKLFTTIIVSTGYLRNTLVKITNMFRKYWMPKGEDRYKGEHLAIVNKFIRAPKERVNDFLIKKQQRQVEKLAHEYHEEFDNIAHAVREMFEYGKSGDSQKHLTALLFSIEISIGCRRIELLDAICTFEVYTDWVARTGYKGEVKLGSIKGDDGDRSIELHDIDLELKSHIILQSGTAKDKNQVDNQYKIKENWAPNKQIVKPSIILNAREILNAITQMRKTYKIVSSEFKTRVKQGAKVGSRDYKPLLEKYFKSALRHSEKYKFPIGSHYGRRLYAVASYEIYKVQVRAMSGDYTNQAVWVSIVLGHGSQNGHCIILRQCSY